MDATIETNDLENNKKDTIKNTNETRLFQSIKQDIQISKKHSKEGIIQRVLVIVKNH